VLTTVRKYDRGPIGLKCSSVTKGGKENQMGADQRRLKKGGRTPKAVGGITMGGGNPDEGRGW